MKVTEFAKLYAAQNLTSTPFITFGKVVGLLNSLTFRTRKEASLLMNNIVGYDEDDTAFIRPAVTTMIETYANIIKEGDERAAGHSPVQVQNDAPDTFVSQHDKSYHPDSVDSSASSCCGM